MGLVGSTPPVFQRTLSGHTISETVRLADGANDDVIALFCIWQSLLGFTEPASTTIPLTLYAAGGQLD